MKSAHVTLTGGLLLLAITVSLTACSYATDFVVVNNSAQVLRVEYHVKEFVSDSGPPLVPSISNDSELSSNARQEWKKLQAEQYESNSQQRTVAVSIMPGQALLVCTLHNYPGHTSASGARQFPLDHITLNSGKGVMLFNGELTRTQFTRKSNSLYVLEYK